MSCILLLHLSGNLTKHPSILQIGGRKFIQFRSNILMHDKLGCLMISRHRNLPFTKHTLFLGEVQIT